MSQYDPRAALSRIRSHGHEEFLPRSDTEVPHRTNIEPRFSRQPSKKAIAESTIDAKIEEDALTRRVSELEEENRALAGENETLRRENDEYARERQESDTVLGSTREKYEAEIALLRDKVAYTEERLRKLQDSRAPEKSSATPERDHTKVHLVRDENRVNRSLCQGCRRTRRDMSTRRGYATSTSCSARTERCLCWRNRW